MIICRISEYSDEELLLYALTLHWKDPEGNGRRIKVLVRFVSAVMDTMESKAG